VSTWLKQPAPGKGPKPPARIDLIALHRHANQLGAVGTLPPDLQALLKAAPVMPTDRWGMPLPLSENEQAKLDRIGAVIASPLLRGRQLLVAGQLGPDEVQAIVDARPTAYAILLQQATDEVLAAGPPIAPWAEAQLAILFGRPAGQVFTDPEAEARQAKASGAGGGPVPFGTPADRRELAVREGGR
jgi:hypothetical protein